MRRMRMLPPAPVVHGEAYLLEVLWEAGPTVWTAMGEQPLGWPDVWAYAQATQTIAETWEMRALIDMSRVYLSEREIAQDPLAMPPWERE